MAKLTYLDDEQKEHSKNSVITLVSIFGSQYRVARELGIVDGVVNRWVRGRMAITPKDSIKLLHSAMKKNPKIANKITLHDLRPDIFPKGFKLVIED